MSTMRSLLIAIAVLNGAACLAEVVPNKDLARLYAEDQADRAVAPRTIDWSVVAPRDRARRDSVLAMLQAGEFRCAADCHAAAMIFQHGDTPEHIQLAHSLAIVASNMDPTNTGSKWLTAAAWDRYLMRRGRPQWYGTPYVLNQKTRRFERYDVDETVLTDKERSDFGVPSLADAKAREVEFNR